MKTVIIASLNPAKINAVKVAFSQVFPEQAFQYQGISVPSGVSAQPMSDRETHLGALNRVIHAKTQCPNGDFFVGLEAGIENNTTFAWMVIDDGHQHGESRSSSLQLPPVVLQKLNDDNELGDVMDELFQTENIKQKGGAISLLTHQQLTRSSVYQQALILALIPFCNPELFPANN